MVNVASAKDEDDSPALLLREFGVAFGDRVVLSNVNLAMPMIGILTLLGPGGTGKSTLLRTLGGLNDAQPALRTWGSVEIQGEPLSESNRPALVGQNAYLLNNTVRENLVSVLADRNQWTKPEQTEWASRHLHDFGLDALTRQLDIGVMELSRVHRRGIAIVCAIASGRSLVMIDEATSGLEGDDAKLILRLLAQAATDRAVLFVTHNREHAKYFDGRTALLAGGVIQECQPTRDFFRGPLSEAGWRFVRTGGCSVASPTAKAEELAVGVRRPPPLPEGARSALPAQLGPRNFYWAEPGKVGGLPRPGIIESIEHDLQGLKRLGVTLLVSLEERLTVPPAELAKLGIEALHFPVPDMQAPSIARTLDLLGMIATRVERGGTVAFHCLAGLGRTGTLLASWLVYRGMAPDRALVSIRNAMPRAVQSASQEDFLYAFDSEQNRLRVG